MVFRPTSLNVEWITTTTPKHQGLRSILIHLPHKLITFGADAIKQSTTYGQWMDLDRLLVQLWESHLTRPKVICTTQNGEKQDITDFAECLLPELMRSGGIDLVG